ncbi:MAG TPA: tetratricopeptide repeat protein [Candidatus Binataceae bacterium]|jgi:tetratricopeptide (TPR) repeat protein|nr:tetratricopeptide repeat protein [Candidatus Binataceae bacterium]
MPRAKFAAGALAVALAMGAAGCLQEAIEANQRQLDQQRAELDKLKEEVAALKAAQPPAYPTTMPPPGSCDADVMREASRRGGERFAANDFSRALGYYQDAVTACPSNAQAQLNLARAYEALGQRAQAIDHYRLASQSTAAADSDAAGQAREALARLGAH